MKPQDFQDYGPMRRRGREARGVQNMALPQRPEGFHAETVAMRAVPRRRPPRKSSSGWWLVPLLLIIIALATALGGLTYLDDTYAGRIYPNVSIQGIDLTEMTPADAKVALRERFDRFLAAPVRFQYEGRSWEPTPEQIGLRVNLDAQVAEAMRVGRGNGLVNDLQQIATIWQQGLDLPLHLTVDAGQLQRYIGEIAGDIEQPAVEASLAVDTVAGVALNKESAEGRMLLLDDTVSEAIAGLSTLQPQVVPIRSQTLEPMLASADIVSAQRTVEAMLQGPMELRFNDQTFALTQTDIAEMITITRLEEGQGPELNAQIDQQKLRKWVTRIADEIGRASVEPRVAWNGGNLQIVREGRSAYKLDIDRAVERLNDVIMSGNRVMDLPVDEVQPGATPENLATLGINQLVASGKSDFAGSAPYRITNIKVGVALMNGILIPPDGEFSFNENAGAIDASQGFVEGYAIVGNRTQLEWGGGICQVSTTLYRAAFWAGLPFEEWNPHRFRISWYEKYEPIGMDAAIFTGGGPDLRFVNDTGQWLLIEGIVDDAAASVTFNIYGTKVPGRTVEQLGPTITNEKPAPTQPVYIDDPEHVGPPKQSDTARGGMDIEIVRVVKENGVEVRRSPFITRFQEWPNIFVKNPQTPLPPGAKLGTG